MLDDIIAELNTPFWFRRQPVAIPADMRPGWRIGTLLLLLRICCRQNRSSFGKLHVLSWAVRTQRGQEGLIEVMSGANTLDRLLVRIEPSLNRAVDLASAGGLIRRVGAGRLELTPVGIKAADELLQTDGLYSIEKAFFARVGKELTEEFVARLFTAGRR